MSLKISQLGCTVIVTLSFRTLQSRMQAHLKGNFILLAGNIAVSDN